MLQVWFIKTEAPPRAFGSLFGFRVQGFRFVGIGSEELKPSLAVSCYCTAEVSAVVLSPKCWILIISSNIMIYLLHRI